MKIELDREIVNNLKDNLMFSFILDDLVTIEQMTKVGIYSHQDDKYNKKLIKAYKRILGYYGHKDDIE